MQLSDFDYALPEHLIAQAPPAERTSSRLLLVDAQRKTLADRQFSDIKSLIEPGDLLVFNDTRVIPARLFGQKQSGGKVEVMIERVIDDATVLAHIRSSKSPRPGSQLILEGQIQCYMQERQQDLFVLTQASSESWLELLERFGHIPLPPYIQRNDDESDRDRYQTVFAQKPGAVAAPTAGLHFDQTIIDYLRARGVETAFITLHVGAGTFQPVRGDNIDEHVMHAEWVGVNADVCKAIEKTHAAGKKVVAVGTTVVRSLESAAQNGVLKPMQGDSRLFIKPGFRFNVVDAILTNFHLPKSTLLMLVSAFAGSDMIRQAYQHAIAAEYRFFSYGDAMYLTNPSRRDGR